MTFLRMWTTGNPKNTGRWSSEEYDRIIADCTTGELVTDYDARWAAMHEAEELVMAEAVIAPLYTKVAAILIRPSVEGIAFHSNGFRRGYKSVTVS